MTATSKAASNPKPKLNFELSALIAPSRSERIKAISERTPECTPSILASSLECIKAISERTPSILASSLERIKAISERTPSNPISRSLCTATCSLSSLPNARATPSACSPSMPAFRSVSESRNVSTTGCLTTQFLLAE